MKALICGGRDFADVEGLTNTLDELRVTLPITEVIHGASYGADSLADAWAKARKVKVVAVPARWKEFGRKAGPLRNLEMLAHRPDVVIAFRGGKGTKHMVSVATKEQIKVIKIGWI